MTSAAIRWVTTPTGDSAWLVTSYEDVKALLSDPRLGRSHAEPERAARVSYSAIFGGPGMGHPSTEAEEHARMRRLLVPAFSARRMANLRPRVTAIIADLLDAMAGRAQPVDLHEVVSFPLPALVICELLGVPYADREDFRRWSDDAALRTDASRSQTGLMQLLEYMRTMVARKQAKPDDDVISDLVAAAATDPNLTFDDIVMFSAGLLFAGHETTTSAIDHGTVLLLTHPEQADALRHNPALIGPVVEEILRLSGSEQDVGLPRYANTDFAFGDVIIRTGELVILGLRAANLDQYLFHESNRFNVHRIPSPHLAFGYGPRYCVGAPLARIELQTLFSALLDRFPMLRLAVPVESLKNRDELIIGGIAELPVTW